MPRNPNKTHCTYPGCPNWAMHGHTLCRAHRDAELGPRGAGAPQGNLNALKHGRHAHPLPPPDLENLALCTVEQPEQFPLQLGLAAQSIQARTGDPFGLLVALHRLLSQLIPLVAARLFESELHALSHQIPPPAYTRIQTLIHHTIPHDRPARKLLLLRTLKKQLAEQDN